MTRSTSRRGFFKTAAGAVAGAAAAPVFSGETVSAQQPDDARTLDRLERTNADASRRIVIRGATIVSVDPKVGNLSRGDILIEGTKIKEIAPDLSAAARDGKAVTIDARDTIACPGFVDPHVHCWQGQIARIIPNSNGVADDSKHYYFNVAHQVFGPHYRPEDIYVGDITTALMCIDAGVTTFCDNSHNNRSKAHADAAVKALMDSGARAVYGGGGIRFPDEQMWEKQWPDDLRRIKTQYFASDDQLVSLRMFFAGTVNPVHAKVARELDLWISWDGGAASPLLPQMFKEGLLVGKESFNHAAGVPDANWALIKEHGSKMNICPRADEQAGYGGAGKGFNGLVDCLERGIRPGLSVDNPCAYAIDMFTEMQLAFFTQRGLAQLAKFGGAAKAQPAITAREVLELATMKGAECCALDRKVGSLTPGKEADILLIRTDNFRQYPVNNAIGAIVQAGSVANLDTVMIGGRVKKFRGRMTPKLLGQDFSKLRQRADDSRQYLLGKAGWTLDIFSD